MKNQTVFLLKLIICTLLYLYSLTWLSLRDLEIERDGYVQQQQTVGKS